MFGGAAFFNKGRGGAEVQLGTGVVGDDVGKGAAIDGAKVMGGVAEDGMGGGFEMGFEGGEELVEGVGKFEDGVVAEVGLGGMAGFTSGLQSGPEGAFSAVNGFE